MPEADQPGFSAEEITSLLEGLPDVGYEHSARVQQRLRAIAREEMNRRDANELLQLTDLIDEFFLRFSRSSGRATKAGDRADFFTSPQTSFRRQLTDDLRHEEVRRRNLARLGHAGAPLAEVDVRVDLDRALEQLEREDPNGARLVRALFFEGSSQAEAARVFGVSVRTIERRWSAVRLRLKRIIRTTHEERSLGNGQDA